MNNSNLIEQALSALKQSYSPYSNFCVGAALLSESGEVFTGCNIENASFSATICAERTALAKAVSTGEFKFKAIAIVGGKNGVINSHCNPCGICLQALSEFCTDDFKILTFDGNETKEHSLSSFLPLRFGRNNL